MAQWRPEHLPTVVHPTGEVDPPIIIPSLLCWDRRTNHCNQWPSGVNNPTLYSLRSSWRWWCTVMFKSRAHKWKQALTCPKDFHRSNLICDFRIFNTKYLTPELIIRTITQCRVQSFNQIHADTALSLKRHYSYVARRGILKWIYAVYAARKKMRTRFFPLALSLCSLFAFIRLYKKREAGQTSRFLSKF